MSQDESISEMFVGLKSLHSPKVQPVSCLKSVLHDELSFVFKLFSGTTLTCKRNPFKKKQKNPIDLMANSPIGTRRK
jgi:hypothetical protein